MPQSPWREAQTRGRGHCRRKLLVSTVSRQQGTRPGLTRPGAAEARPPHLRSACGASRTVLRPGRPTLLATAAWAAPAAVTQPRRPEAVTPRRVPGGDVLAGCCPCLGGPGDAAGGDRRGPPRSGVGVSGSSPGPGQPQPLPRGGLRFPPATPVAGAPGPRRPALPWWDLSLVPWGFRNESCCQAYVEASPPPQVLSRLGTVHRMVHKHQIPSPLSEIVSLTLCPTLSGEQAAAITSRPRRWLAAWGLLAR